MSLKHLGSGTARRMKVALAVLTLLACATAVLLSTQTCVSVVVPSSARLPASPSQLLGNLPLYFEPNQGQTDPRVTFLARGAGYGIFFTPTETLLRLTGSGSKSSNAITMKLRTQRIGIPASASLKAFDTSLCIRESTWFITGTRVDLNTTFR